MSDRPELDPIPGSRPMPTEDQLRDQWQQIEDKIKGRPNDSVSLTEALSVWERAGDDTLIVGMEELFEIGDVLYDAARTHADRCLQPPTDEADLQELLHRLSDGSFYEDYDEDLRLVGVLRTHLAARRVEGTEIGGQE